MGKNKEVVATAKVSQPTQKDKTPTGKVKTMATKNAIKKEREIQYRNFRINALKRRAKRMNIPEEEVPKLVEKLIAQLDAPKQYSILIFFKENDGLLFKEALNKEKIDYKFHGTEFFAIDGDETVLAKIREIAPPKAKIHPYANKMEPVLKPVEAPKDKKPSNNTPEAKKNAKQARKTLNKNVRAFHKKNKGKNSKKFYKLRKLKRVKTSGKEVANIKKAA